MKFSILARLVRFERNSSTKTESGAVFVELAMILPVLLLLLFGGFEYSRILRIHQTIASMAREVGRVAYRECAVVAPLECGVPVTPDVADCLRKVLDSTNRTVQSSKTLGAPFIKDVAIRLSAFSKEETTCPTPPCPDITNDAGAATFSIGTLQPAAAFTAAQIQSDYQDLVSINNLVIVTQVRAKYDVLPFQVAASLFSFGDGIKAGMEEFYYVVVQ